MLTRGKPRARGVIKWKQKYVIGADIGGTTVKLGLFEEDGTLLEKWEIPTVIEGDGTAVLRDIAAEIQKCREKHNIPADGIWAWARASPAGDGGRCGAPLREPRLGRI